MSVGSRHGSCLRCYRSRTAVWAAAEAAMTQVPVSVADHDTLESELAICCRQLQSKEQALKILKEELDISQERADHSQQEIAQLRSQLARSSSAPKDNLVQEREQFIAQLEASQEKIAELERQLQMEEDQKEEVLGERDYFSSQCSALRRCLEEKENSQPPSQSALQTLAEENRQLKLKLVEVQAERDQAQARIDRYKRAVERKQAKDKQEQQATGQGRHNNLRQALQRMSETETLANSLSESVREKSIALTHQKKANKMLGARIADLEHRLKVFEISGLWSASSGLVPSLTWNEGSNGMEAKGRVLSPEREVPTHFPTHTLTTSPPAHTTPLHHSESASTTSPSSSPTLSHTTAATSEHSHVHMSPPHTTHPSQPHTSHYHSSQKGMKEDSQDGKAKSSVETDSIVLA